MKRGSDRNASVFKTFSRLKTDNRKIDLRLNYVGNIRGIKYARCSGISSKDSKWFNSDS